MNDSTLSIKETTPERQTTPAPERTPEHQSSKGGFKACAWIGAICAAAAWLALIFNGSVSFFLALAGVIISSFGARSPKGLVRDMAITAIVASAVLILVFAIFFGVIFYLDKTLG